MTVLEVTFPDSWATLSMDDNDSDRLAELLADIGTGLGEETRRAFDEYFSALLPALRDLAVDGFASLVINDAKTESLIQAFCAIGVVARGDGDLADRLRDIAEGGLHPGLERDTTTVELPLGTAVRSSAFRFAEELLDEDGIAPYAAEVRFAFPLAGDRIGVLHFETLSLVYYDELLELFDAIAATARVA